MREPISLVDTATSDAREQLDPLPARALLSGVSPLRAGVLYDLATRACAAGLVSEAFVREQLRVSAARWPSVREPGGPGADGRSACLPTALRDSVPLAMVALSDYNPPMEPSFDQMTPAERVLYVQDLWDRIAEHPEGVPVSEEMKVELDRRLADHRADPSSAIPWEQVKAELRRRT